jgi:DNA-binding response OmpR family regulator
MVTRGASADSRQGPPAVGIDLERRMAVHRGRRIALTPIEFSVLKVLIDAAGRPVEVDELLKRAWHQDTRGRADKVRIVIARLRRRLGDPRLIETIAGEGYRAASLQELA